MKWLRLGVVQYDSDKNLNHSKSQPLLMLLSQSILISFVSNFGFYNPNKVFDMELEVGTKLEVGTMLEVGTK